MHDLRLGIFMPPGPWEETLENWTLIEQLGFDCAGLTDHFMPTTGTGAELEVPFPEAWVALTALALQSERLRVAVLVSGNSYRSPVLLAKQAVTLDHITGGRVDLGIGAGWYEAEYRAFGFPFPSAGQRVDMLEEALQIIQSLFTQRRTTFHGEHYQLEDAPFEPKPLQDKLPIMIGGRQRRMMALVARYADIWSIDNSPDEMRKSTKLLERACAEIGRAPAEIRRSAFVVPRRVGRDPWESLDTLFSVSRDFLDAGANELYFRMPTRDQMDVFYQGAERLQELREEFAQR